MAEGGDDDKRVRTVRSLARFQDGDSKSGMELWMVETQVRLRTTKKPQEVLVEEGSCWLKRVK